MTQGDHQDITRGSVWRRWDPHVHLPGTLQNNQFGKTTIPEALDFLAAASPAIEVVGITDYYSTQIFRNAQEAWKKGSGKSLTYLFPNVELRLSASTQKGSGVNLHLLCAADDVDGLDDLVGRLTFTFRDNQYRADRSSLIALGRAYSGNSALPELAALSEGANQFKVNFDELRQTFQGNAWAREHCLVAVAGGKNDGTSGIRAEDGAFTAYRQAIERFAHIIFSSSDAQREFWLGHGADTTKQLVAKYNGLKPCLHGSDAHDVAHLGKPSLDRLCWIKGDPHFGALKLACLAPESRAYVGFVHPGAGNDHGRIAAVSVNDSSWFKDGRVPLNSGLVAIIGPRGSGKTALADIIAIGAGSAEPFGNQASFVKRAGNLLSGSRATVEWPGEDDNSRSLFVGGNEVDDSRRVRYLSQQFVERLCASDGVSDDLISEIERVIFNNWPVEDRQGATTFRELLDVRLESSRALKSAELETIANLSDKMIDCLEAKRALSNKRQAKDVEQKAIENFIRQIGELTAKADEASAQRHGLVSEILAKRQVEFQAVDLRVTQLKNLQTAISTSRSSFFINHQRQLRQAHPQVKLTEEQWSAFLPRFSGEVDPIVAEALAAAQQELDNMNGSEEGSTESLDDLDRDSNMSMHSGDKARRLTVPKSRGRRTVRKVRDRAAERAQTRGARARSGRADWVRFDEPQRGQSGDAPYRGAQIWGRYLLPAADRALANGRRRIRGHS